MGWQLRQQPASRGREWVRHGVKLWFQHPMALAGMFMLFMFAALLLAMLLPGLGTALGLGLLPLLSLGYMIAGRRAAQGQPLHPLMMFEGLSAAAPPQRRAQLLLCLLYMLGSLAVLMAADWVDGGTFRALQEAMAESSRSEDAEVSRTVRELMANPRLADGMLVRFGLAALLAVPFWHAPALVHWAGQGVGQSLFSSALAVWRNRGAFFVYMLGWIGMMAMMATVAALLTVVGARAIAAMLSMPLALVLTTAFYASLWYVFVDSFETERPGEPAASAGPSDEAGPPPSSA